MSTLPTGTVTFLFTDIEGSTSLARGLGPRWAEVLAAHESLLTSAIGEHQGIVIRPEGDAVFAVFGSAVDAVAAAAAAQKALASQAWPQEVSVLVRMGLHSGEGTLAGNDYIGLDVHLAARIAGAGHGGQVLLSDSTRALVEQNLPDGVSPRDLGQHRLKDFDEPQTIHQLLIDGLRAEFEPLKTLDVPSNLPAGLTSFVGRDQELKQIPKLLETARMVTLTGPGGTGKSRLAIQVASELISQFPEGVYFVELAPITDPELVATVIGSTLGLGREGPKPILESLKSQLRDRAMLLVLDNFEQVIDAAPAVGELLGAAPRLKLLVTSREPLRIAGEQEFPVPTLEVPDPLLKSRLDELMKVDSVGLFLQRARLVRPDFDLTTDNANAVAEICVKLEGLPLAIELAAARARLFEPADLLARLDRRLSFLAGGRDLTERQRTLRGAIDWSHELLLEPEQIMFRCLSVFGGGCTIEAAEAVCRPQELGVDSVDVISSLHDKSLLIRDERRGEGLRLAMLETIREYAGERLDASGEGPEVRKRHAEFFLSLAQQAVSGLTGRQQEQWLKSLDRELDNFRAMIRWAIDSGQIATGLQAVTCLNRFWVFGNHMKEGRRHIEDLLVHPASRDSKAVWAAGVAAAADLAGWQGDYDASHRLGQEALAAFRELGDFKGVAGQLTIMGYAATTHDPAKAIGVFEESIQAYRRAGGLPEMGEALVGLALPLMQFRKIDEAARHLEEALALFQAAGDDSLAMIASGLRGVCSRLAGDLSGAKKRYLEVLAGAESVGAHMSLTLPLSALADLALVEGDAERAAVLEAAQAQLAERLGGTPSFQLMGIPDVAERARAELGDERFEAASERGRSMSIEDIARLAST